MPTSEEQQCVIAHASGHALISAVAGSGKTTTMIHRIMALLERGVAPENILVLMFNKGARDHFSRRLSRAAGDQDIPSVFTFHGFGNQLCQTLTEAGLIPPAVLMAEGHQTIRFARDVLTKSRGGTTGEDELEVSSEMAIQFLDVVDLLKSALFDDPEQAHHLPADIDQCFLAAFSDFERARQQVGYRFLSDLIYDPVCAARASDEIAERIANRYDHIIVDEFQDVSEVQMALIRLLAGTRAEVMVVGDEDQTIYSFRGARSDYMTHVFEKEFPSATRYALSRTFRFGHSLSLLANHTITNNTVRMDKLCVSAVERPTAISVRMHTRGPGQPIVEEIKRWTAAGGQLNSIAILIRQFANSLPVEIALHHAGILYRVVGAAPFVDRPEILALRAYLQLACGGLSALNEDADRQSLLSAMLAFPTLYLRKDKITVLAQVGAEKPAHTLRTIEAALNAERGVQEYIQTRRKDAMVTWRWCSNQSPNMPAAGFLTELCRRTKLFECIAKSNPRGDVAEEISRMLQQVIDLAAHHTIGSFLAYLNALSLSFASAGDSSDRVLITSIHRAKGMEFPMVIVPDLADGQFPLCRPSSSSDSIEDERRLFYVAITRAMQDLVLVAPMDPQLVRWTQSRMSGHPDVRQIRASRFLYEGNIELSIVAGHAFATSSPLAKDDQSEILTRYRARVPS